MRSIKGTHSSQSSYKTLTTQGSHSILEMKFNNFSTTFKDQPCHPYCKNHMSTSQRRS